MARRRPFDFQEWMLQLDEPSRTRLDRFLEFAANAIAIGHGSRDAVPSRDPTRATTKLRQTDACIGTPASWRPPHVRIRHGYDVPRNL
jgi:hypothetical protein